MYLHNYTQYQPTYNIITNTHHVNLQLLDPFTCLITNLPIKLPHNIITTHELLYSQKHKGYISKLKMLNSLKRCFQQIGLNLLELPNLAFKMFKSLQLLSSFNMINLGSGKKNDVLGKFRKNWGKGFGGDKSCKFNKIQYEIHRKQIMYVGRWILTPHQSKIVHYFIQRGKRMIIGDGWNMGKTVTSLACMHYAKLKKILVIVPKLLLAHWYWHISQLCTSLSKNTKSQSDSSIHIQLLQFYQKLLVQPFNFNLQHTLKHETKTPKHEPQKKQSHSLKQQSHSQTKTLYSLVSYQKLSQILTNQQQFITNKQYTAIIFDQLKIHNYPQQPQWLTTPIYYSTSLPKKHLVQLSKIQSIIICKNTKIQHTREFLPILNTKIDQKQLYARYGNNQNILDYPYQYTNALYRTFYCHNLDICDAIPGNLIKHILISNNVDILISNNVDIQKNNKNNKYNNKNSNNQIIQQKQQNNIQQIPKTNKYLSILSYIKLKIQNNKNNRYYIIYNQYQTYVTIKQYLQNILNINIKLYNLTQMNQYIRQNLMKNIVYIGTINQTIKYLTNNNNNKYKQDVAIICDQFSLKTNSIQYYEMKLYVLYKYINIQYINLCAIQLNQKTYSIIRHNNNKDAIYIPYINRNKYINKLLMQGQQISSDSSMLQKQDKQNPQRYIESEDSEQMKINNRMIDQIQQKILIKNNRNYGNVNCLEFSVTGEPYRNSINMNMNNNICNIDDSNLYAKNNINDNNPYTNNYTTNKNNKQKVQIQIDSDDAQQIFFQSKPKLHQLVCQIQSQSNKMDIENDNHQLQILNNQLYNNNKQNKLKIINNKQSIDKININKKSNIKNKSNSKQKYVHHQPIQQQKVKTKNQAKKFIQIKQKQQSKQKLKCHKNKQIQKQIIEKHKNYNKKISKNNDKYNTVLMAPIRRSTRNCKPINYNIMQNLYLQQHMIELPQIKLTVNKNSKQKQINQLITPKQLQLKQKTQLNNQQIKKQKKSKIIITQPVLPQTKAHQFIQINSDQSSMLNLKYASYLNNKKQPKVKSKHVLQVKLIPNLSQLYENNFQTIC